MFTGIIEEIGKVQSITQNKLSIECNTVLEGVKLGDSIAVNGVCLTVVKIFSKGFVADVSPETLKVTTLGCLGVADIVNLERAMKADGRFGGHIVSGHVDGKGNFISCKKKNEFYEIIIELTPELSKYVIKKTTI